MREITIPNCLKITSSHEDLIKELKQVLKENDSKEVAIFCGLNSYDLLGEEIIFSLESEFTLNLNILDFSQVNSKDAEEIASQLNNTQCLIGIGGGKALDFTKYTAAKAKKKFISIPSLISHDGICSPVSVIKGESLGAVMPSALIVPLFILRNSPLNSIYAGIGDLISNLSAIEDWHLANKYNNESLDDFAILLSKKSAFNVLQRLSLKSKSDLKSYILSDEFLQALIEGLSLSGIAMSISGNSRPCSGAEHMISHAIDSIYGPGTKAPHGIQVAIATIYLEKLREERFLIHDFSLEDIFRGIGAPASFRDIGIEDSELKKIIEEAPKTRPGRFTVLDHSDKLVA